MQLVHAWTRRVASDEPLVKEGPQGHVAVSADFTVYLIRADGKLLAKKYYKGTRLGKPCVGERFSAFPGENALFLYENKKGKPSGVIHFGGKGVDCAFRGDELALLMTRKVVIYKYDYVEGKFLERESIKYRPRGLAIDWGKDMIIGTEDGLIINGEKVKIGRVEHVRQGPLIAASVPGGVALLDGTTVVKVLEGYEVTGLAWLGDLLAIGDRGGKRVVVVDPSGEVLHEFKFPGAVRSMDWVQVLAVAQRRKVLGYILLPEVREEE